MLDELDDLARLLAEADRLAARARRAVGAAAGRRAGLHTLADLGPRALADRRVIPRAAWLVGRSTRIVRSPVGVVGLRGPSASPWCEPALETAASLLAGNAVIARRGRGGRAPARRVPARGRAGRAGDAGRRRRPSPSRAAGASSTFRGRTGSARCSCSRARRASRSSRRPCGRRSAGTPRPPGGSSPSRARSRAWSRRSSRARRRSTETIGPPEVVVSARTIRASSPRRWPLLAVVEVPDADTAVLLASREGRDGPISIWARDPAKGERVARRLPSPATWVGHYGEERPNVEGGSPGTSSGGNSNGARRGRPASRATSRPGRRWLSSVTGGSRDVGQRCGLWPRQIGANGECRAPPRRRLTVAHTPLCVDPGSPLPCILVLAPRRPQWRDVEGDPSVHAANVGSRRARQPLG